MPIEVADLGVAAAIAAMAVATYAMRAGGFWLMGRLPPSPALQRTLNALPGSVIAATIVPIVVREGTTAMLAVAAAVATMLLWRRDVLAVAVAMVVAAAARAIGF